MVGEVMVSGMGEFCGVELLVTHRASGELACVGFVLGLFFFCEMSLSLGGGDSLGELSVEEAEPGEVSLGVRDGLEELSESFCIGWRWREGVSLFSEGVVS